MQRATSVILLVGGAALLATWLVAPAASAPKRGAVASTSADQPATPVTELDAEVSKLHDRLLTPAVYQVPVRDPFNFQRQPARVQPPPAPVPEPVSAPLPRLVAIVSNPASGAHGAVSPSAALSYGDDVQFVHAGETSGDFLVKAVSTDAVTLVDSRSGVSSVLTLQ